MSAQRATSDLRVTFIGPVPPLRSGIAQHGGHLAEALAETAEVTVLSWQHQYPKRLFGRAQVDPDATSHPRARFMLRWWDPVSWWRAVASPPGAISWSSRGPRHSTRSRTVS
jgi:hypothetical protein